MITTPVFALVDFILWFLTSTCLLIAAIIRFRRMKKSHEQIHPQPQLQSQPLKLAAAADAALSLGKSTLPTLRLVSIIPTTAASAVVARTNTVPISVPVALPVQRVQHIADKSTPDSAPLTAHMHGAVHTSPVNVSIPSHVRSSVFVRDRLPYYLLLSAILLQWRYMVWANTFYAPRSDTDTVDDPTRRMYNTAYTLQVVDALIGWPLGYLLLALILHIAHITFSCVHVSVTLSPLPRRLTLLFDVVMVLLLVSMILTVTLPIVLHRRWPKAICYCTMASCIVILGCTILHALWKLASQLQYGAKNSSITNRMYVEERAKHMRRGAMVGAICIGIAVIAEVWQAWMMLSDQTSTFLRREYEMDFGAWVCALSLTWMLWFFWTVPTPTPTFKHVQSSIPPQP